MDGGVSIATLSFIVSAAAVVGSLLTAAFTAGRFKARSVANDKALEVQVIDSQRLLEALIDKLRSEVSANNAAVRRLSEFSMDSENRVRSFWRDKWPTVERMSVRVENVEGRVGDMERLMEKAADSNNIRTLSKQISRLDQKISEVTGDLERSKKGET